MEHTINLTSDEIAFLSDLVNNHLNGTHELLEDIADRLNRICNNKEIEYDGAAVVNPVRSTENHTHGQACLWVGE